MDQQTQYIAPVTKKAGRIISNIVFGAVALFAGTAIVHAMIVTNCDTPSDYFKAGVLPPDVEAPKASESVSDVQKCIDNSSKDTQQDQENGFEAGVIIDESEIENSTQNQQNTQDENSLAGNPDELLIVQTSAPAPTPAPQSQPVKVKPAETPKPKVLQPASKTPAKKTTPAPAKAPAKSVSVDLDKLSIAVAMQETHNCKDTKGAALVNNCHGFKKNGKFLRFNSPAESHAYFKNLWAKSYGGIFPTYRLAQIYSGNDRPTQWLKNVTYYYNKL